MSSDGAPEDPASDGEAAGSPDGAGRPLPPPEVDDGRPPSSDRDLGGDGSLIGVSFDRQVRAQEFLLAIRRLREDGALELKDAVTLVKDAQGRVKVTETIDPTPGRAALSGAVWTGLLGLLLGGPVGWLAGLGVGAGAGAVTAKIVDLGIPDEWVDWFKLAVRPGTATVVVLLEHLDLRALRQEAARFPGAEVVHTTLPLGAYSSLVTAFDGGTS